MDYTVLLVVMNGDFIMSYFIIILASINMSTWIGQGFMKCHIKVFHCSLPQDKLILSHFTQSAVQHHSYQRGSSGCDEQSQCRQRHHVAELLLIGMRDAEHHFVISHISWYWLLESIHQHVFNLFGMGAKPPR